MPTGARHYLLAEQHLDNAANTQFGSPEERYHHTRAQIHATLAHAGAAASALAVAFGTQGAVEAADAWTRALRPDHTTGDPDAGSWHILCNYRDADPFGTEGNFLSITHPAECGTLPTGATCWATNGTLKSWWPTELGTYRIRPRNYINGGDEDGPNIEFTLDIEPIHPQAEADTFSPDQLPGFDDQSSEPEVQEDRYAGSGFDGEFDESAGEDDGRPTDARYTADGRGWAISTDGQHGPVFTPAYPEA